MNRKNRFYYYYRTLKWKLLKDRSPIAAAIKITQRCNLRCKHCTWQNKIIGDLSFNEWKDIIDDLYTQGVTTVIVEGGEPTLHADASKIIEYINSKGMYSIFITNGTQKISHINPDVFWLSIEGMRDSHDKIRGKGVFDKVMNTLENNQDKKIISLTSISKTNVNDIEPMCKFFSGTSLSGLLFHFSYPYRDIKEPTLDAEERKEVSQKIIELKEKYSKIVNSISYLKTVGKNKKCYPWLLVVVTSDGKQQHGCMVRHIEKEDCSKCDMGCYGELSRTYESKRDSLKLWSKTFGFPRLI